MKTLFNIGEAKANNHQLVLEIGKEHCCYGLFDVAARKFDHLSYCSFDELAAGDVITELTGRIGGSLKSIVVGSAFEQALLVPQPIAGKEYALSELVYDLPAQKFLQDTIQEWQMVIQHSMPQKLYDQLLHAFPEAVFFHAYTPAIKIYNGFVAEDQVSIHFSLQQFRVIVKKDNALHLVQTYTYKTPLDVVYYLLKICAAFGLEQSHLFLIVSGLIDKDSAMFTELHHYFLNLHFAAAPASQVPDSDLPHYYFTSLYNLAACAS